MEYCIFPNLSITLIVYFKKMKNISRFSHKSQISLVTCLDSRTTNKKFQQVAKTLLEFLILHFYAWIMAFAWITRLILHLDFEPGIVKEF